MDGSPAENGSRYVINVTHPDAESSRVFTGLLYGLTWEFEEGPCFYVGNSQAGPIYEVQDPNDSVIEGSYEDYRVTDAFETNFPYSRFDESQCSIPGIASGSGFSP